MSFSRRKTSLTNLRAVRARARLCWKRFDALQLWLQIDNETREKRAGIQLDKEEQEALAKRNGSHEKPLKGEAEIRDIYELFERGNLAKRLVTASEFKEAYNVLRSYSVQQIGQVLTKLGIAQETDEINGTKSRLRLLPMPQASDSDTPF